MVVCTYSTSLGVSIRDYGMAYTEMKTEKGQRDMYSMESCIYLQKSMGGRGSAFRRIGHRFPQVLEVQLLVNSKLCLRRKLWMEGKWMSLLLSLRLGSGVVRWPSVEIVSSGV